MILPSRTSITFMSTVGLGSSGGSGVWTRRLLLSLELLLVGLLPDDCVEGRAALVGYAFAGRDSSLASVNRWVLLSGRLMTNYSFRS